MRIRLLPALLAAAAVLASCRPPIEGPEASRRIDLWEQEDAVVTPYVDSVLRAFEKLPGNEGVRVVRTHYHTEDLRQQFLTSSIAGSPPDLIMGPSDSAGVYSVAGFILPVDGLFDLEGFNRPVMEAITLDGKAWGVPISNGNHLMLFYNKKFSPSAPQNTRELFAACDRIKRLPGMDHCMAMNIGEPFWLMPWLGAFGGWPIDNKTPTLDTEAMRKAIAFLSDMVHNRGYVPEECDYNCVDALFKEEKAAFIVNGDWALSVYAGELKEKFGVARIPRLSATGKWPTPMISGKYLMLSSALGGEKLELVKRLVDFYANAENQREQFRVLKRLPALTEAARSPEIEADPHLKASLDQLLVGKPMPMATEMRAVWDAARSQLGRAMIRQLTPAEAARKMHRDAFEKIREMNE